MPEANDILLCPLPGKYKELRGIPYLSLFYGALEEYGVYADPDSESDIPWIKKQGSRYDGWHVHWPEQIWRGDYSGITRILQNVKGYYLFRRLTFKPRAILGIGALKRFLACARNNHIIIIWTVHDLVPHSKTNPIDRLGFRIMASQSDLIICHSQSCKSAFAGEYGHENKIMIMHHGNFQGAYPTPRPPQETIRELGLNPEKPLVCMLGGLRKYKGVSIAVDAIKRLSGSVQLILAGQPFADFPLEHYQEMLGALPYVRFFPRSLTPQEFSDFGGASEAFLLPYRKTTTSGVMMAAITFNRGFVASNLPYFEEFVGYYPNAGRLAQRRDGAAFAQSIQDYLAVPKELRLREAKRFNADHAWSDLARPVAEKIKKLAKRG